MKRWHEETSLMTRRWRMELANHDWEYGQDYPHCYLAPPSDAEGISCHCSNGIGVMRKSTPYGCHNSRCAICHWGKFYEPKRRGATKRAAIEFDLQSYE